MEHVDFLPERIKVQRSRRRRLIRHAYLLGLGALVLAVVAYARYDRIQTAQAELAMLNEAAANVKNQSARREDLETQLQDLMVKKRVEEHFGSRISAQLVLAELQRQLPPNTCLTRLELDTVDIAPPGRPGERARGMTVGAAPRGEVIKRLRLVITGLAPTDMEVANFIGQLSTSPLFEDVAMGYAKQVTVDAHLAREFRASCLVAK